MPGLSSGPLLLCIAVVLIVGELVEGWLPGGSSLYECCCQGCHRECFSCRNPSFTCNCDKCSCYAGNPQQQMDVETTKALIGMLMRTRINRERGRRELNVEQHQHQLPQQDKKMYHRTVRTHKPHRQHRDRHHLLRDNNTKQ